MTAGDGGEGAAALVAVAAVTAGVTARVNPSQQRRYLRRAIVDVAAHWMHHVTAVIEAMSKVSCGWSDIKDRLQQV